jgi:hypothetical protein
MDIKEKYKGAIISECGKYRFRLWRIWDFSKPKVLWIMHNPSTADGDCDDATIRKITKFTKTWGYGGLYVGNLFPYREKNPNLLKGKSFEEIAPMENFKHIQEMVAVCDLHILAYGNPVIEDATPELFDKHWHHLGELTKFDNPRHPLYLRDDLKPRVMDVSKQKS